MTGEIDCFTYWSLLSKKIPLYLQLLWNSCKWLFMQTMNVFCANADPRVATRCFPTIFFRYLVVFSLLFVPVYGRGQLCEGSLGDPIVNIDFGSGSSTHGQALPSGTTSYTYSTADFPLDGSYTIENTTSGSGSSWWSTTDHTGNTGGYMMVVNASISLTDYFYKNTITGLCPGTLYEFASWVMNLLRSQDLSPPNITFLIQQTDGTVISSFTTGPISLQSGLVWRQFGFNFITPPNVSTVVIVMRNNSAGGIPANDIALDDITFRPCGPDVSALIVETMTTDDTLCIGSDGTLHLQGTVSAGFSDPRYQWQEFVNGDGLNDVFKPVLLGVSDYVFRVFNRWGEQLFETHDPLDGWDGRVKGSLAPSESYVYRITFREDVDQTQKNYVGWFVLLN